MISTSLVEQPESKEDDFGNDFQNPMISEIIRLESSNILPSPPLLARTPPGHPLLGPVGHLVPRSVPRRDGHRHVPDPAAGRPHPRPHLPGAPRGQLARPEQPDRAQVDGHLRAARLHRQRATAQARAQLVQRPVQGLCRPVPPEEPRRAGRPQDANCKTMIALR